MKSVIKPKFNFPSFYAEPMKYIVNDTKIQNIDFFSGRISGKSYNVYQIAVIMTFKEIDNNVLIIRGTKSQLRTSSFTQVLNIIHKMGLTNFFKIRTKAMTIENLITNSMIYFEGIEDDPEKIKGFTPRNDKLSLVVFDEFTELSSSFPLNVAIETLIRFKGSDSNGGRVKVLKLGNPSRWNAHWSWDTIEQDKLNVESSRVYSPTWESIKSYLEPTTIEHILNTKKTNPRYYKWAFLGERLSYEGLVYENFTESCMIGEKELYLKRPVSIICGLDPASKRDKTAFVVMVLYTTGELVVHDMWVHNPKQEGRQPLSPSQQGERIMKFFNNWCMKPKNIAYRLIPKIIVCDPASGGLDVEIRNNYGNTVEVVNVPNKKRMVDIQRNQNSIATGRLKFKRNEDNLKPLFDELSMMVWRDKYLSKELRSLKSTNLTIGEDDCHDAMTYGVNFALTNARFMQYNPELFTNLK